MSELENEIKNDKEFIEKVADRIYKDTDDWEEAIAEPEWIDRMTEIADRYIERFEVTRKLADKWLQSKQQPQLNDNQQKYLILLQRAYEKFGNVYNGIFFSLVDYEKKYNFPNDEFFQVIEVFARWAQEQEGE